MHHTLKIYRHWHIAIAQGRKNCEIRNNDRDFQAGDTVSYMVPLEDNMESSIVEIINGVRYQCIPSEKYRITHVQHFPQGLRDNYVVLSLKKIRHGK